MPHLADHLACRRRRCPIAARGLGRPRGERLSASAGSTAETLRWPEGGCTPVLLPAQPPSSSQPTPPSLRPHSQRFTATRHPAGSGGTDVSTMPAVVGDLPTHIDRRQ